MSKSWSGKQMSFFVNGVSHEITDVRERYRKLGVGKMIVREIPNAGLGRVSLTVYDNEAANIVMRADEWCGYCRYDDSGRAYDWTWKPSDDAAHNAPSLWLLLGDR